MISVLRRFLILSFICGFFVNAGFAQIGPACKEKLDYHQKKVEGCFDDLFKSNFVNKTVFKASFENYFIRSFNLDSTQSKSALYTQILKRIKESKPIKNGLPVVKDEVYVWLVSRRLGFAFTDLINYVHVNCIGTEYRIYQQTCSNDSISGFYAIGGSASALEKVGHEGDLSMQLIAGAILYYTPTKDLEQECLQDAIMMLFWFKLASIYGDAVFPSEVGLKK